MAVQTPPYVISASSHSAELFRRATSNLVAGNSTANQGVTPSTFGGMAVAQNGTPNMSVNVGGGEAWVQGTQAASQGRYYCLNDATVNLAIATSDATNPRIDLVCVTVNDAQYSGVTNNCIVQVVTGTPAPSPVVPANPSNSLPLANVRVNAGVTTILTGVITDVRPFATSTLLANGVPMFSTGAAMVGGVPPGVYQGPQGLSMFRQSGGVATNTTDGSGNGAIAYPTAFPNAGTLVGMAMPFANGTLPNWNLVIRSATGTGLTYSLLFANTAGTVNSTLLSILWEAWGW